MGLREGIPSGDHKAWFSIELNYAAYFGEAILSFSHKSENEKIKNENNRSSLENWKTPADHEKVKIKDVSEGENLFEVPKDEGLDCIPIDRERLPFLIEET